MNAKKKWLCFIGIIVVWLIFDYLRIIITFSSGVDGTKALIGILEIFILSTLLYNAGREVNNKSRFSRVINIAAAMCVCLTFFALCGSHDIRVPIALLLFGFLTLPFEYIIHLAAYDTIMPAAEALLFSVPFLILWGAALAGTRKSRP